MRLLVINATVLQVRQHILKTATINMTCQLLIPILMRYVNGTIGVASKARNQKELRQVLYSGGPQECRPNTIECLEVINDSFETLNVIKDAVAYQAGWYPSLTFTHKAHATPAAEHSSSPS